jgi:hypothetical protein
MTHTQESPELPGRFTLKIKTVSADGKETTTQATYKLNGEDYLSMGNLNFDSLSGIRIDTNTAEFTLERAGKPVGKIRRSVSKDGQTLTINFVLKDANGVQTAPGLGLISRTQSYNVPCKFHLVS